MKKSVLRKITAVFMFAVFFFLIDGNGIAVHGAEPVVVVLDPGHGGENLGAEYGEYTEKEMTMAVAKAMKEELEKYEGIKVYLTHETDKDMSLEERAEFARDKNADFLFCLHFNMSEEHNKFGAEVWVSAFGDKYQKGYTFASVEMDLLVQKGLYSRGIKTRLNDSGEDYYGILRHCTAMDVPAALIEHCHLDEENDWEFYDSREKIRQFGILDATAVAMYFGLRSEELGVDYGTYRNVEIPEPVLPVKPDTSEPDVCFIEVGEVDSHTGEVTVHVTAADYDSHILYYSYSYDGGETFSPLQRWEPRSADSLTFTMQVPSGTMPEAVVNVYNAYDRITESNHVSLPSMRYGEYGDVVEAGSMTAQSNRDGAGNTENAGNTGSMGLPEDGVQTGADGMGGSPEGSVGGSTAVGIPDTGAGAGTGAAAGNGNNAVRGEPRLDAPAGEEGTPEITVWYFLRVCLVCTAILFFLLLTARLVFGGKRRRRSGRPFR